jgi:hypothetical protein
MKDKAMIHLWVEQLPGGPQNDNWYRLRIDIKGNEISFYIDDTLVIQKNDDTHTSGGVWLGAYHAIVEFDNVTITGDGIPDGGSGFAVTPKGGLTTVWGKFKQ